MTGLVTARRRAETRGRALAIAVSVGVHGAVLAVFIWELRPPPPTPAAPAIDIELTAPWPLRSRRRLSSKAAPRPSPSALTVSAPRLSAPPVAPLIPQPVNVPPTPLAAERPLDLKALRGAIGCEDEGLLHMSPTERQGCRDRLAGSANPVARSAEFGIDARTRSAFDVEARRAAFLETPFLAEKPKKGCRPRLTEENIPVNAQTHDWIVSVACGVPF